MTGEGEAKPKLIIDEDWKTQVQREKEALEKAQEAHAPEQPATPEKPAAPESLPPATFPVLISTLATQAMVCLGQIPNPITGKPELALAEAKHFIDSIQMLEEKTKGNCSPQETAMLRNVLQELRLAFVAVRDSAAAPIATGEGPAV